MCGAVLWLLGCSIAMPLAYADASTTQLSIREVNITGDEFIVLQNVGATSIEHLNAYWLGYVSSEIAPNIIPTQQLPDVTLEAGQAYLVNGGTADTCGAVGAAKLSFSLSNTSGTVSLRQLTDDGTMSTFQTIQSVSWNSNKTSPATSTSYLHVADEANVTKYKSTVQPMWYKPLDASAVWQVGFVQACSFTPVKLTTAGPSQSTAWTNDDTDPPFSVLPDVTVGDDTRTGIPAADIGLKAVQLSELLPNPAGADTDAEFIEVYNPNGVSFDLSGFKLQYMSTTSATVHSYTFPDGTTIDAKSFKAFYGADTHLSLGNSGGKVWLVDSLGTVVTESAVYDTTKEGQAWILAAGKWQWTLVPTPGTPNKLATPITTSKSSSKKNPIPAVKGTSTAKPSTNSFSASPTASEEPTPVHPGVLAGIVLAALLYGAYEYRTDLANYIYQLRRYRAARRGTRG